MFSMSSSISCARSQVVECMLYSDGVGALEACRRLPNGLAAPRSCRNVLNRYDCLYPNKYIPALSEPGIPFCLRNLCLSMPAYISSTLLLTHPGSYALLLAPRSSSLKACMRAVESCSRRHVGSRPHPLCHPRSLSRANASQHGAVVLSAFAAAGMPPLKVGRAADARGRKLWKRKHSVYWRRESVNWCCATDRRSMCQESTGIPITGSFLA